MAWLRIVCLFLIGCGLIFAASFSFSDRPESPGNSYPAGGGMGGGGGAFGGGGGVHGRLEVVRVDPPTSLSANQERQLAAEQERQLAAEVELQHMLAEVERQNAIAEMQHQNVIADLERSLIATQRQKAMADVRRPDVGPEKDRPDFSAEIKRQEALAEKQLRDAKDEFESQKALGKMKREEVLAEINRQNAESKIVASRTTEPNFKLLPTYNAPLPAPPTEAPQFTVVHQFGAARGFYAAAEFLAQETDSPFTDFLASNNIELNLQPSHMAPGNTSADWARVGVVSGVFQCLDSTQFLSEELDDLDQKKLLIEESILAHAVSSSEEFCDPIVQAQLLNSLEVRWKKIKAAGNAKPESIVSLDLIPLKIGSATNQTSVTAWWDKIWSSSIFATIGGVLLAMLGVVLEKKIQGPVQLAVVQSKGPSSKSRKIPNSKQKSEQVERPRSVSKAPVKHVATRDRK